MKVVVKTFTLKCFSAALGDMEHIRAHLGKNRSTKITHGSLERGKGRGLSIMRWYLQLGRKKFIGNHPGPKRKGPPLRKSHM